jgi:hypothetical protein
MLILPEINYDPNDTGMVTNIPANMVVDQFGMIGLLTFIRAAETDPNLGRKQTSVFSPLFVVS